jgi:hypothetical protein
MRILIKLLITILLTSCSKTEDLTQTELITDSYFFQKNTFNLNLYNCNKPSEDFDSTYKKTSDLLNFYKLSELTEKDDPIVDCIQTYAQIKELTPLKEELISGDTYMELSNCDSKVEEDILLDALAPYLEYLKKNNVQVWTGISNIENNNFYWINIWESENYREQFLAEWINSVDSGKFAKALSLSALCQNPSTYLFL